MKIIITKNAGVCWGVERAIEMAYQTVEETTGKIVSLGPLVHNPEVVHDFQNKGVQVTSGLSEVENATVIFRSHGVPVDFYEKAEDQNLKNIYATCPFLKR